MTHLDDGADLRAVMDRSLRDLDAPDHCGPAALASGRRIRTRRRVTLSLTGVAAVAAVAALTLPALGGAGDAGAQFAGDPSSAPVPSEGPGLPSVVPEGSGLPSEAPEGSGISTELAEGWWSAPGTRLAEQLERVLPDGVIVESVDTTVEGVPAGSDAESIGGLHGILSASTGPGAFQIILYGPEPDELPDPVTTTDAAGNEHTTATAESPSMQHRIKCRAYMETATRSGTRPGAGRSADHRHRVRHDVLRGVPPRAPTAAG